MLENIEKELQEGGMTPGRAADLRVELSGQYSFLSGELEEVLRLKPAAWIALRKNERTDKSCDRAWDASQEGLKEMSCRMRLKRIDKVISALTSFIRIKEGEAKNLY